MTYNAAPASPVPTATSARQDVDRYCGGNLGCVQQDNYNYQNSVVSMFGSPFVVGVHYDDTQSGKTAGVVTPKTENVKGFHLNYLQLPC